MLRGESFSPPIIIELWLFSVCFFGDCFYCICRCYFFTCVVNAISGSDYGQIWLDIEVICMSITCVKMVPLATHVSNIPIWCHYHSQYYSNEYRAVSTG